MTAKKMKKAGRIGSTGGIGGEQRAIVRRNILESSLITIRTKGKSGSSVVKKVLSPSIEAMFKYQDGLEALRAFERNRSATEEEQFAELVEVEQLGKRADREVSNISFQEKLCGSVIAQGQNRCQTSAKETHDLSSIVVSLALFDGDKMLFACSGIPVPEGTTKLRLTRFVTTARLVEVFNANRFRDDNLRVAVGLPDNTTVDGFLGLYDNEIAIVTCIGVRAVVPVGMNQRKKRRDGNVLAAGRAFNQCYLMAVDGYLSKASPGTFVANRHVLTEAVLGGPLIGNDERFLGMITDICREGDAPVECASFLPQDKLCGRLKDFQIINHNVKDFRGYKLPSGVKTIYPSGFLKTIYRLKSFGYPMPPPLVLEFNGELLDTYEDDFGEYLTWKGYPFGDVPGGPSRRVWGKLQKHVVTDISRRVVSLSSFNGHVRHFTCTGLLIKWPGRKATCAIILTSASLVRSCDKDDIDRNLRIEVFRPPPMQRVSGNLEYYSLNYNVAIVSVKENFNATRPQDIFNVVHKSTDKVLAVGRDCGLGVLMASTGVVNHRRKARKLDCKDLQVSTCKIKKVGIGGPLISCNGGFAGMNFYDGSEVTPFLPRSKIIEVLSRKKDYPLPSEGGHGNPVEIESEGVGGTTKINKWPVPEPYWCHGGLDVSMYDLHKHIGRVLQ